jgi:eukaryotic-like serine/threonine-protein kinase
MSGPSPDWRAVERLLDAALDLPPADRAAFLAATEATREVRAEVERLLAREGEAERFLAQPAAEHAASLVAHLLDGVAGTVPAPPPRVGAYRLEREIGHGGMGTVYLGERDDGEFVQRVAVKLVRGGLADESLARRFREERQILAALEHPNIARLVDGGVTGDGVPWLAMEYVDGLTIDRHCEQNGLEIEARLALFCTVCDAVGYAHRRLVVHRDIKPSNILVTEPEDGQAGEPKLLDFGIARLLDTADPDGPTTGTAVRLMTPEFASPEQVRGERATTASDVYSLGVLLYRLLTGSTPYPTVAEAAPHELARAIVEVPPPPPSSAALKVSAGRRVLDSDAEQTAEAVRWRRRLRGDLDAIVLMALRKEPERRYPSAERLAADVHRFLHGRPVEARPDTRRYRASRFVRRHRAGVAAAACAAFLSVGAATFHTLEITRERDHARREAGRAEQVTAFLVDMFQQSDPYGAAAGSLTIGDYLRLGAERLERELTDQPVVRATLMNVVGQVYTNLGRYDEADALLRRALEVRRTLLPAEHPDIAESLADLGIVQLHRGDYTAADSLLGAAVAIQNARPRERRLEAIETLSRLAKLRIAQQEFTAADSLNLLLLPMRRELLGAAHPSVANTLNELAVAARGRGDFGAAEAYHREAIAIRRAHFGDEHAVVAESIKNLALALHSQHRYVDAEPLYREALGLQTRLLGADHPEIGSTLQSLASLLRMQGDYTQAEPLFRRALEIQQAAYGAAHPRLATTLDNLAGLVRELGDFSEAERLARASLAIRREVLAPDHPSVALGLTGVGVVLRERGRSAEADAYLAEAVTMLRARLGPDHPFTGIVLHNHATVAAQRGDPAAAEPRFREALRILQADSAGQFVHATRTMLSLATLLVDQGRASEAEPLLRDAHRLRATVLPPDHWMVAEAAIGLGHGLLTLGRPAEAEPLLRSGVQALQGRDGFQQDRARRRGADQLARLGADRTSVERRRE